jgi:hypothetical protein
MRRAGNNSLENSIVCVKLALYQIVATGSAIENQTTMNPYEAARELIRKIESHRVEIGNHQKLIGQLQGELQSALKEADLKTSEGAGARLATGKATVAPSDASGRALVKRSHKKKVVTPAATSKPVTATPKHEVASPKAAAVKTGKKKTAKARSSSNRNKSNGSTDKPTLGDLVRTVIIQAGRPLKREEIQAGLQALNYSNSTGNPYRTLGVRLHRLQSRGVVSAGRSQFDVTPQWKQKHKRLIAAAEKKAASDAAKLPPAPEPAPAQ